MSNLLTGGDNTEGVVRRTLTLDYMPMPMLLLLAGMSIAQVAEPTGTLALACEGERMSRSSSDTAPTQEQVSMGITVNFTDRTINGFGGDWSLPIPILEVTETALTFADRQAGLFEASVIGTIEFVTGDMEAVMKVSGKSGKLENFYSLKCKPTQRMF